MQRDDSSTSARSPADLDAGARGRQAGGAACALRRHRETRTLATTECPVVYEAPIATRPSIGRFVDAVERRRPLPASPRSCSTASARRYVAPRCVDAARSLRLARGQASRRRSMTKASRRDRRDVVPATASCQGYFLGSYSRAQARPRNRRANARRQPRPGRSTHGDDDLARTAAARSDRGLLVTELLGTGRADPVRWRLCRDWRGRLLGRGRSRSQYPVEEIGRRRRPGPHVARDIAAVHRQGSSIRSAVSRRLPVDA